MKDIFQATSAKQEQIDSFQCSSVGVGTGNSKDKAKINAENNRIKALTIALQQGHYSYSDQAGGGCAICK